MASLVLKMSVSLDGFVAPIDGSTDWVAAGRSEDGASWTLETLSNAGAHLVGATTYAGWAAYWPGASGPFAKPMNEIPKVVFSDSLASADWGETTIAAGDLAEAITRLKQERSEGYLLAHGGARFARSLVETADEHHRLQRRSRRPRLRGAPVIAVSESVRGSPVSGRSMRSRIPRVAPRHRRGARATRGASAPPQRRAALSDRSRIRSLRSSTTSRGRAGRPLWRLLLEADRLGGLRQRGQCERPLQDRLLDASRRAAVAGLLDAEAAFGQRRAE